MSDGVPISIPAERTEPGERLHYNVSADEALQIAVGALDGIVQERINGDEDLVNDHDTRRALKKEVLSELREEFSEPYMRI